MKWAYLLAGCMGIWMWTIGCPAQAAAITNEDFANGLSGWTTVGDVQVRNQEAVLGDNNAIESRLYQGTALDVGAFSLDFDFSNALANNVPSFGFPDTFFASLLFVNDINQLDVAGGVFDGSLDLFNLDTNGVFDNTLNPGPTNGAVGPSPKGSDWQHFTVTFQNSLNYAVPVFELVDGNFVNADSQVRVDNVSVRPVPEPSTFILLGSVVGVTALWGRYRKQKH